MMVKILIERYILEKNDKPVNVNQLLDFVSVCYINNKLSIKEYRNLSHELTLRGATKPEYYFKEESVELIG